MSGTDAAHAGTVPYRPTPFLRDVRYQPRLCCYQEQQEIELEEAARVLTPLRYPYSHTACCDCPMQCPSYHSIPPAYAMPGTRLAYVSAYARARQCPVLTYSVCCTSRAPEKVPLMAAATVSVAEAGAGAGGKKAKGKVGSRVQCGTVRCYGASAVVSYGV
eukprot:3013680-Rhodomonas_salina.2